MNKEDKKSLVGVYGINDEGKIFKMEIDPMSDEGLAILEEVRHTNPTFEILYQMFYGKYRKKEQDEGQDQNQEDNQDDGMPTIVI